MVFGSRALRSVGGRSGGAVRQASGGHALPDAGVHPGPRHLQPTQLSQREGSHVQQAAVGAAQLLEQHLNRKIQTLMKTVDNSEDFVIWVNRPFDMHIYVLLKPFGWKCLYYLSGRHVLERHPAADQLTGHNT